MSKLAKVRAKGSHCTVEKLASNDRKDGRPTAHYRIIVAVGKGAAQARDLAVEIDRFLREREDCGALRELIREMLADRYEYAPGVPFLYPKGHIANRARAAIKGVTTLRRRGAQEEGR